MNQDRLFRQIYKTNLHFLRPLSLLATCEVIIDESTKLTGANYGTIYIKNKENELQRVHTTVPQNIAKDNPRPEGFTYRALKTAKPYILDYEYLKKYHPNTATEIKCMVMIPIYNRGRPFAVITLQFARKPRFLKDRIQLMPFFSSIAALAIRKAQLYHRVTKALEDRDLFISIAGHELKTPLTAVSVYNQMMAAEMKKGKMPDIKWNEGITDQINRLSRLINDFLHIRAIKRGEISYVMRPCSAVDIVNQAVAAVKTRFKHHTIRITSRLNKDEEIIEGDFDKLLQVINNLVINAAKFSEKEHPINISLSADKKFLHIKIQDEGPGIARKELSHIFDKYYRASKKRQGMGIGLYLSKNIIEAHKGSIKVHSVVNKGATFELALPRPSQR